MYKIREDLQFQQIYCIKPIRLKTNDFQCIDAAVKTENFEKAGGKVHENNMLQARYEQYRLLFEKAADVIYSVDADFRILYVSPSVEKHLGYMPEELTGRPFSELGLLTADSLARSIADTMRILNGEVLDAAAEYQLIAKDGSIRIAEIRSTPVYKNGTVVSIVSVARDITTQRNAEKALVASETRFRTMAENISNGLIIMEEGKIVYVNDRACQLCGYPREELVTLWGPNLTAPQSLQHKGLILQASRETGVYPDQVDAWITRKDGTQCCLSLRFSFAYSSERKQTGYVLITDTTEQRLAEEKIKETVRFLDNIIESSLDAIVISDSRGFITRVNKAFLALTGHSGDEVCGKRMYDLATIKEGIYEVTTGESIEIDAEYMDYTRAKVSQFIREKQIVNWESYLFHKNGKAIPVDVNIVYLYNEQGVSTGTFGILRDTTERKKAERKITETTDFLNNIIDSSLDPIVIGDHLGNITRINKAFVDLIGFEQAELMGKHMAELVPPRAGLYESTDGSNIRLEETFYDRAFKQMSTLIEKGNLSDLESFYFKKDGKVVPVEQTMFYLYDKKGNSQAAVAISRDTSERKRAEQKLIEAKNFLGDIIRTSADGIVVTDTLGTITLVNDAVERILGYSKEDLVGKNTNDYMLIDEGSIRGDFRETSSGKMESVYYYESRWAGKDGRMIDLGMSVGTLKDLSGNATGMVACVRDITDRKAAERKLYEYQNQLRCLASQLTLTEEQERRHIASEIHDRIAQSLALAKIKLGALGATVTSKEEAKDVASIRSLLEQSIKDTRSLIFELSPPFLYEFGLEKALEWLLEDIEQQHGVKTRLACDTIGGSFDDDVRILIYQSVRELLINVVKHAHAKTATVSLDKKGEMIHVSVEDDGQGFAMSPDGFKVSSQGGYGIFSIRERFQHLGGSLTVESKLHQGTRIAMELPLVQDTV